MGIRQAVTGDEDALRAVRLRALTDAPDTFATTAEHEEARTLTDWQRWLAPGATFFFEPDDDHENGADNGGGRTVGLVAGVVDTDDPDLRHLMACWVDPAVRGTGVGNALVEAVLSWARLDGARRVQVEVYGNNTAAIGLYERHGFRRTGTSRATDDQGRVAVGLERDL